jgi:hypothetical protein
MGGRVVTQKSATLYRFEASWCQGNSLDIDLRFKSGFALYFVPLRWLGEFLFSEGRLDELRRSDTELASAPEIADTLTESLEIPVEMLHVV